MIEGAYRFHLLFSNRNNGEKAYSEKTITTHIFIIKKDLFFSRTMALYAIKVINELMHLDSPATIKQRGS